MPQARLLLLLLLLMLLLMASVWTAAALRTAADMSASLPRGGPSTRPCLYLNQCSCQQGKEAFIVNCRATPIGAHVPLAALRQSVLAASNADKPLALRMVRGNLSSLQAAAFSGLSLSAVDVSYNRIGRVDKGAFKGVSQHLTAIKLSGNGLAALPTMAFRGLTSLRDLDLSDNKLGSLKSVCHRKLPSLRSLAARRNNVASVDAGCWHGAGSIAYIDLSGNALTRLPAGAFDELEHSLQVLKLADNRIAHLQPEIFVKLRVLRELWLSGNRLSSIDFLCHAALPSLNYAVLSGNRISSIAKNCWSGVRQPSEAASNASVGDAMAASAKAPAAILPQLWALMLSGNRLRNADAVCSPSLLGLRTLALDHNLIEQVPRSCFANKTALASVTLSDNRFTELDCCLGLESTRVRHLDLSHNVIRSVSKQFLATAPHLIHLDLQDNFLNSLEPLCGAGSYEGAHNPDSSAKLFVKAVNNVQKNFSHECVAGQSQGRVIIDSRGNVKSPAVATEVAVLASHGSQSRGSTPALLPDWIFRRRR